MRNNLLYKVNLINLYLKIMISFMDNLTYQRE
jgi:hypothetical protein